MYLIEKRGFAGAVVIVLLLLIAAAPYAGAAPPMCDVAYDGNQGTSYERSVTKAYNFLLSADSKLNACNYVNGGPWQPCAEADKLMGEADTILIHVFNYSFVKRCWNCEPGHEKQGPLVKPSLVNVAYYLAMLDSKLEQRTGYVGYRSYENTFSNIKGWIGPSYPYCAAPTSPPPPPALENCVDGVDNDRDGQVDCADPDCPNDTSGYKELQCSDGRDNDCDRHVDCDDIDCTLAPNCNRSQAPPPGPTGTWVQVSQATNPLVKPVDTGWRTNNDNYFIKESRIVSQTTLYQQRKLVRSGETIKFTQFTFQLLSPIPNVIKAGDTLELTISGKGEYGARDQYNSAEVCLGQVWLENERGNTIKIARVNLTFNQRTGRQTLKFTVPASLPQEFHINYAISGTAAFISWTYQKR